MDNESKVHTMFKASRHRAPHVDVAHGKSLGTAKATDTKELWMVLAPSVGSSKGHYKEYDALRAKAKKENIKQERMKRDNLRDNSCDNLLLAR